MPDIFFIMEVLASIAGIVCVYLQTRENIWAWPFGIFSVTLFVFIFFNAKLYSDTILHVVYIALNIYGWVYWSRSESTTQETTIVTLNTRQILLFTAFVAIGTWLWGYTMLKNTDASFPYVDAFTTVGSLVAQFLLARKVIQNWILWIIVDIVAINIYLYKGLNFTAFMFFIFLVLCTKGYIDWRKKRKTDLLISQPD